MCPMGFRAFLLLFPFLLQILQIINGAQCNEAIGRKNIRVRKQFLKMTGKPLTTPLPSN